ncbi:MAG: ribosome maturation factor RimM [Myxococcales bacterium]
MSAAAPELLAVGRVARAHGLRGRILVAPYNAESSGLERASALWLAREGGEPRRVEVRSAERANLGYLVALRGLDNRNAAEALRGNEVWVARAELPSLDEGEFYASDLVGMEVRDGAGVLRGAVTALETAGRQELLTVRTPAGVEVLVPLGLVREVEEGARRIVVDAPEGLFELEQPGARATAATNKMDGAPRGAPGDDEDDAG